MKSIMHMNINSLSLYSCRTNTNHICLQAFMASTDQMEDFWVLILHRTVDWHQFSGEHCTYIFRMMELHPGIWWTESGKEVLWFCMSGASNMAHHNRRKVRGVRSVKWYQRETLIMKNSQSSVISIQPKGRLWQEPEPSQATGMALAHCILGSFLGVGCHCFPPHEEQYKTWKGPFLTLHSLLYHFACLLAQI